MIRLILLLFFLSTCVSSFGQKKFAYRSEITGDTIRYIVYFPKNYSGKDKVPLLLFLHGMGEKTWPVGSFNEKVRTVGLPALLEQGFKLPFVVVVPNCPYPDWDNIGYNEQMKARFSKPGALPVEVAQIALKRFAIDSSRMYITGISMGGGGTFSAVQNYEDVFAAALPVAGWGDQSKACNVNTPVWAFQGSKDGGAGVKAVMNAIAACNPNLITRCNILEGKGHFIWDEVYANEASEGQDIYQWMLQFQLKKKKTPLFVEKE